MGQYGKAKRARKAPESFLEIEEAVEKSNWFNLVVEEVTKENIDPKAFLAIVIAIEKNSSVSFPTASLLALFIIKKGKECLTEKPRH